jgi:hypothetical protein
VTAQPLQLDAETYARHALHNEERVWAETNCYVDLWIELLHAHGLDPVAAMAFTVAMDFEGDQWTFFKQPLTDLYTLYGVDVQELTIWRPVAQHTVEQVSRGRSVLIEVDSFFLPDTAGVAYKLAHTKTTIAVQMIDVATRTLGYFHNAGYYTLSGDDFDGVFRLGPYAPAADTLAPYTEFAKFDGVRHRTPAELTTIAIALTQQHLARRPRTNPVARYRERFPTDVAWLTGEEMEVFHQYAFATLRQCGACAELAASFVRWLDANGEGGLDAAYIGFEAMANSAKSLQFKLARTVATKKPFDPASILDTMESGWESAMTALVSRYAV